MCVTQRRSMNPCFEALPWPSMAAGFHPHPHPQIANQQGLPHPCDHPFHHPSRGSAKRMLSCPTQTRCDFNTRPSSGQGRSATSCQGPCLQVNAGGLAQSFLLCPCPTLRTQHTAWLRATESPAPFLVASCSSPQFSAAARTPGRSLPLSRACSCICLAAEACFVSVASPLPAAVCYAILSSLPPIRTCAAGRRWRWCLKVGSVARRAFRCLPASMQFASGGPCQPQRLSAVLEVKCGLAFCATDWFQLVSSCTAYSSLSLKHYRQHVLLPTIPLPPDTRQIPILNGKHSRRLETGALQGSHECGSTKWTPLYAHASQPEGAGRRLVPTHGRWAHAERHNYSRNPFKLLLKECCLTCLDYWCLRASAKLWRRALLLLPTTIHKLVIHVITSWRLRRTGIYVETQESQFTQIARSLGRVRLHTYLYW